MRTLNKLYIEHKDKGIEYNTKKEEIVYYVNSILNY